MKSYYWFSDLDFRPLTFFWIHVDMATKTIVST